MCFKSRNFRKQKVSVEKKPTKILALTFANYNFSSSFETKTLQRNSFADVKTWEK